MKMLFKIILILILLCIPTSFQFPTFVVFDQHSYRYLLNKDIADLYILFFPLNILVTDNEIFLANFTIGKFELISELLLKLVFILIYFYPLLTVLLKENAWELSE